MKRLEALTAFRLVSQRLGSQETQATPREEKTRVDGCISRYSKMSSRFGDVEQVVTGDRHHLQAHGPVWQLRDIAALVLLMPEHEIANKVRDSRCCCRICQSPFEEDR